LLFRSALTPEHAALHSHRPALKNRLALAGQVRRRIPDPFNLPLESSDISAWSGRIAQLRRDNVAVIIQGRLGPDDRIEEAGIVAQVKARKEA
jgi:hypothetical protein